MIALYPNSSCFYSARVTGISANGEGYVLVFVDDNNMERIVAREMVLEVPEHLLDLVDS